MWEFLPIHSYLVVILSGGKKDDPSHTRFARSLKKPNNGKSAMQLLPWADIEVLQGKEGTESTSLLRDDLVIRISLELGYEDPEQFCCFVLASKPVKSHCLCLHQ